MKMMTTKSSEYWKKRKERFMYEQMEKAENTSKKISKIYAKSGKYLEEQSHGIFAHFKKEFGLSDKDARLIIKSLDNYNDINAFKNTILSKPISEDLKPLIDEITSSGYVYRLKRLEYLQKEIDNTFKEIYNLENNISTAHYEEIITSGYNQSMFELQKQVGIGFSFAQADSELIKKILKAKWYGDNYSGRIWKNTKRLAEALKEEMLVSMLTGRTQRETKELIKYKMGVGDFEARRLVRTESCFLENEAEVMAYEEAEIERYRIIATLDGRTSDKCRRLDNKSFLLSERRVGVNYPPLHPFCRTTTIADFGEEWLKTKVRSAENKDGKADLLPGNIDYKEWLKKYGTKNK